MAKCSGITRAGTACKGIPIEGSQWCYVHHPDHDQERRRHGARGGKRGGRGRPMVEVHAVKDKLQDLADRVLDGSLDRADAAVVSQIYNVLLRAVSVELRVREQEEILLRLEELEQLLERQKEDGRRGA